MVSRVERNKNKFSKIKEKLKERKIKKLEKEFYNEIMELFKFNRDNLKIDTFYSCLEKDRNLNIPILNIRNLIKKKIYDKPEEFYDFKLIKTMNYSNHLKYRRNTPEEYENDIQTIYNEIRKMLIVSALYSEKKIENGFSIIIKKVI